MQLTIINVRDGRTQTLPYELTTEAGLYQTNFGRVELVQMPTGTPGVSLLEGTMHFYDGATAEIQGTLSAGKFRGTSTSSTGRQATFELIENGHMFEGHVTQGRKHRFVFVKRN